MMLPRTRRRACAGLLTAALGFAAVIAASAPGADLQGRIVGEIWRAIVPWTILDQERIAEGASVPADTNVIVHLPVDMPETARELLLGGRGDKVRYWGYCYPPDYDADNIQPYGFPGKMFLSEAERRERERRARSTWRQFSLLTPPTREDLERTYISGRVRHQKETFFGGETCYIMAEQPLPIGPDYDGDGLNAALEKQARTDPHNPDTDGDGLSDGVEFFNIGTNPLIRDTDGDGLIDGLEVHLHDTIRQGDTNPLKPDSDGDGLCDGFCRIDKYGRLCTDIGNAANSCIDTPPARWAGEDKNLNGQLDKGETDPLKWDTDGNGISDLQEYYNCLLQRKTNC